MEKDNSAWDQETFRLALQQETEQVQSRWLGIFGTATVPTIVAGSLLFLHSCAVNPGEKEREQVACFKSGSAWMPVLTVETSDYGRGEYRETYSKDDSCVPREHVQAVLAQNSLIMQHQQQKAGQK